MTACLEIGDRSAQEWFDRACEHKEANELDQAIAAYRRTLDKQLPLYPEAHFSLANVLAAMGKRQAAEERFRVTIEQNRNMMEAWYNFGRST